MELTRLDESHVEYFVHLAVVGGDVEHAFRRVLDAGYVDGNQVFGHLLPLDGARATRRHVEHFGPQPEHANGIRIGRNKTKTTIINKSFTFKFPQRQNVTKNKERLLLFWSLSVSCSDPFMDSCETFPFVPLKYFLRVRALIIPLNVKH